MRSRLPAAAATSANWIQQRTCIWEHLDPFPFWIHAEFRLELVRRAGGELQRLITADAPDHAYERGVVHFINHAGRSHSRNHKLPYDAGRDAEQWSISLQTRVLMLSESAGVAAWHGHAYVLNILAIVRLGLEHRGRDPKHAAADGARA